MWHDPAESCYARGTIHRGRATVVFAMGTKELAIVVAVAALTAALTVWLMAATNIGIPGNDGPPTGATP